MNFGKWFKGAPNAVVAGPPPWTGGSVHISTMQINSINGAGVLYGFMDSMNYGEPTPGTVYGSCDAKYFIDNRNGGVVVRLAGIVSQGNGYLVFGWQSTTGITADPVTMPPMTWKIKIDGGTIYDFTSAPAAGTSAPVNSRYLSVNVGWAGGQNHTIDFV